MAQERDPPSCMSSGSRAWGPVLSNCWPFCLRRFSRASYSSPVSLNDPSEKFILRHGQVMPGESFLQ
ncbi:mCG148207 [Mus musculus]|nr:mCG148207 [Mus musculus]